MIILSVKDVIYLKRKAGKRMTLGDLKRCSQKNLNIKRLHVYLITVFHLKTIDHFECQRCNIFKKKNRKKNDSRWLKKVFTENLNIKRLHEIMIRNGGTVDRVWNIFLVDLREDSNTKNCWYLAYYDIIPYFIGAPSIHRP